MLTDTKRHYETYWSPEGYDPTVNMSRDLSVLLTTHVSAATKCLDVGCGDGSHYADWLNQHAASYVGVDISENAVRRAGERGLDASLIDDAASLPFDNESFDVVTCFEVFEHLFEPSAAASEILRILSPGGVLLASVLNVAYWRWRLDLFFLGRWNPAGDSQSVKLPWRDPHIRFFNRGALHRMLSQAGFKHVTVAGHGGGFLNSLPWIGRRWTGVDPSDSYRFFRRQLPAIFGQRLVAVARK